MRQFAEREDPMQLLADILGRAKVERVHVVGQAIDSQYSRDRVAELLTYMREKKWTNGEQVTAMVCATAASMSNLKKELRYSVLCAMIAHMWAYAEDCDEARNVPDDQKIYFLFPSSDRAVAFAERMKDFLQEPSEPLQADAVGPYARVVSRLCQISTFREDVAVAARALGGDQIPQSAWKERGF